MKLLLGCQHLGACKDSTVPSLLSRRYIGLNHAGKDCLVPLVMAAYNGQVAIVNTLLPYDGLDSNSGNYSPLTSLALAGDRRDEGVVGILLELPDASPGPLGKSCEMYRYSLGWGDAMRYDSGINTTPKERNQLVIP